MKLMYPEVAQIQAASVTPAAVTTALQTATVKPTGALGAGRTLAAMMADRLDVLDNGLVGDGATDDTAALNALITSELARTYPRLLWFPAAAYVLAGQVVGGPQISFAGQGPRAVQFLMTTTASKFKFWGTGTSIATSCHNCLMDGFRVFSPNSLDHGGLWDLKFFSDFHFHRVQTYGPTGLAFYLREGVQDGTFYKSPVEWSGKADGTIPCIQMDGTDAAPVNNLEWNDCRNESNRSTWLKGSSTTTFNNKFTFKKSKVESQTGVCVVPHFDLTNMSQIYFDPLNLAMLTPSGTLTDLVALLKLTGCNHVYGVIQPEYSSSGGMPLRNYVYLDDNTKNVDLVVAAVGSLSKVVGSVNTRHSGDVSINLRERHNNIGALLYFAGDTRMGQRFVSKASAPTAGTWRNHDKTVTPTAAASGTEGLVCTTTGSNAGAAWASGQTVGTSFCRLASNGYTYRVESPASAVTAAGSEPTGTVVDAVEHGADNIFWRCMGTPASVFTKTWGAIGA